MKGKFGAFGLIAISVNLLAYSASTHSAETPPDEQRLLEELEIPSHLEGGLGVVPTKLASQSRYPEDSSITYQLPPEAMQKLKSSGDEVWRLRHWSQDDQKKRHYRMKQFINGLEVVGAEIIVHVDSTSNAIESIDAQFLPSREVPTVPLTGAASLSLEINKRYGNKAKIIEEPRLGYLRSSSGKGYLVWQSRIEYTCNGGPCMDDVFVDASTGTLVESHALIHSALDRRTYTASGSTTLPGTLLISEGGSSGDIGAQTAYTNSGSAYSYFSSTHARDGWNGSGAQTKTTVHYDASFNGSYWFGASSVSAFGDGDGVTNGPWHTIDLVGHEFSHGVNDAEANLTYANESGALDESMADIFGAMVERTTSGLSANTWKVGEGVVLGGGMIRSMSNPALFSDPDYYPDRLPIVATPNIGNDYGDVHSNSGISNLAFYLLSQGGTHPQGKTTFSVTGIGYAKAEKIFYLALRDYLLSSDGFVKARTQTSQVARNQYGTDSAEHQAVCRAWNAVGVPKNPLQCQTDGTSKVPPATFSFVGNCYGQNMLTWSAVSGATSYELWYSSSATDFSTASTIWSGTATTAIISVLGPRYIGVKACDSLGCSRFTAPVILVKKETTCTW